MFEEFLSSHHRTEEERERENKNPSFAASHIRNLSGLQISWRLWRERELSFDFNIQHSCLTREDIPRTYLSVLGKQRTSAWRSSKLQNVDV